MFKSLAKTIFSRMGIDIRRLRNHQAGPSIPHPFIHFDIDVVFDIGANEGQFASELRSKGYDKKIVSFEPLPAIHKILVANSDLDPRWQVHERVAIGATLQKGVIHISGNALSSSLLPMLPSHAEVAPDSIYVGQSDVDIVTLDSLFDRYVADCARPAIKIDAQGFEQQVLAGAEKSLGRVSCVLLELSTVQLYENQKTYDWFVNFFETRDFQLWWLAPGFTDPTNGRVLQFDACYVQRGGFAGDQGSVFSHSQSGGLPFP